MKTKCYASLLDDGVMVWVPRNMNVDTLGVAREVFRGDPAGTPRMFLHGGNPGLDAKEVMAEVISFELIPTPGRRSFDRWFVPGIWRHPKQFIIVSGGRPMPDSNGLVGRFEVADSVRFPWFTQRELDNLGVGGYHQFAVHREGHASFLATVYRME